MFLTPLRSVFSSAATSVMMPAVNVSLLVRYRESLMLHLLVVFPVGS